MMDTKIAIKDPAGRFAKALQSFESDGHIEPLLACFAPEAEIASIGLVEAHRGVDGAKEFWTAYRSLFDRVLSTFTHAHTTNDLAVLEWQSTGALAGGQPITYRGVTILEYTGQLIRRFDTYYDSAAFVPGGVAHLKR